MILKSKYVVVGICIFTIVLVTGIFVLSKHNLKTETQEEITENIVTEQRVTNNTEVQVKEDNSNNEKSDRQYFDKYIKPEEAKFFKEAKIGEDNDKLFESLIMAYVQTLDKMNSEVINEISFDDISDKYYKNSWVKILAAEGEVYYELNRANIAEKYKQYISPANYEWLLHLDKNIQVVEDGGLTITPDELREYIIYLENFKEKYLDFIGINDVKSTLKWYGELYLMGLDNTMVFNRWENRMNPDFKSSYENFLNENQDSVYYPAVKELYEKAKENNFQWSEKIQDWHWQIFYKKYFGE